LAFILSKFIPWVIFSSFFSKFLKMDSFFSALSSSFFYTPTFLMALYAQSFSWAIWMFVICWVWQVLRISITLATLTLQSRIWLIISRFTSRFLIF
jgi:hypothetical protein